MNHKIPVRKMNFDLPSPSEFDPKWAADSAFASYPALCASLYVAYLEPFLVKSMRHVLDQITDPNLREDADRFARQEAQHYQQHERFNELILSCGYPGLRERLAVLKEDFDSFFKVKGDRWCIGFVEGFESYTYLASINALKLGLFEHPGKDKRIGLLFKWHLTEEIEHRHVAHDIYQHLYGDYLFRVRMCFFAQSHIAKFTGDCTKIMSAFDTDRFDSSYSLSAFHRIATLVAILPIFIKTYMPWHSPHRIKVSDKILEYSREMTGLAESVN